MKSSTQELVRELTPLSHKQLIALAIAQSKQSQPNPRQREDVAIIGLHCKTPGADSPDEFWRTLMQHPDVFQDLRDKRFALAGAQLDHYSLPNRAYSYTAGLIEGIDQFDPGFFGISPREACGMDPQQRLVLQSVVSALAQAGYAWETLRNSKTGVFVGAAANEYGSFNNVLNPAEEATHAASGNALNVIAGRVAYVLGLQGPAIALDTACSSSLVALHMACESLFEGDCEQAIVSGVNVILSPVTFMLLCQGQMLSPDGRCKTFDKDANGYVRAEAVATVILKPLSRAQADGDRILACVKASAVNQDGRSAGLTVPSSNAQQAVILAALNRAKLRAEQIDYVECHGTGTALGDPIEVQTLANAYCNGDRKPLILGAAKSCIGHAEAAAGLVGLIKAVLALENECIPPQAQFSTWNPKIHADTTKLMVPRVAVPWQRRADTARRCAVSAFGFSGTNAHVILEEYSPATSASAKMPLPPIQFDNKRYWWKYPVDPVGATICNIEKISEIQVSSSENGFSTIDEAVRWSVAKIAGVESSSLAADMSLSGQLGFDSIMMARLRELLTQVVKHPEHPHIPLQWFFGNDTLGALVSALKEKGFTCAAGDCGVSGNGELPVKNYLDEKAVSYFKRRSSIFDKAHPQRIDRKLVHKMFDENVLVADLMQLDEKQYLAEMTQDTTHGYYYEHYLDHVPGLYIIEAVRQAATALCHLFFDIDYSHAFILGNLSVNFSHFVETDQPAFMHLRIKDEMRIDGRLKLLEISAHIIQNEREVAHIAGGGEISSRQEYSIHRGEKNASATQTNKERQLQKAGRVIACFDLDGTLTESHTFWRFLLRCAGKKRFAGTIISMLPMLPGLMLGMTSWLHAREILIERCLRGIKTEAVARHAAEIADYILQNMMRANALDALRWHQKNGHETFIVSNSAEDYLAVLGHRLGMSGVFGSRFEVVEDRLSGKLLDTHCQGMEKVRRVASVVPSRDTTKIYAYGDSTGDIEMLNWSDYPYLKCF